MPTLADAPRWVGDVLGFWFSELDESRWFAKSDETDALIRSRFLSLHERLVAQDGAEVAAPGAALAAVLVLDQFPRNMFRGSARAFSSDPLARRISRSAIAQGFDLAMTANERLFLYLPFEHSEELADQEFALELIGALGREDLTRYARAHMEVIRRFGRFPHRNEALGRQSTAGEIEFLKGPASSF